MHPCLNASPTRPARRGICGGTFRILERKVEPRCILDLTIIVVSTSMGPGSVFLHPPHPLGFEFRARTPDCAKVYYSDLRSVQISVKFAIGWAPLNRRRGRQISTAACGNNRKTILALRGRRDQHLSTIGILYASLFLLRK